MKFTTAAIAASAAALVSASPCGQNPDDTKINDGDVFRIMTIRSGSDIQYGSLQAANSALYVNTPAQNASCSQAVNYASFRLSSGDLYLNTDNPPQQLYIDRSGMGQGVIQYTTGAQGPSKNSERTGFMVDESSNLIFRDRTGQNIGLQACPNARQGGYSVWLDITQNPGGNSNCVGFIARALKEEKPVTCSYTS
ncbi:Nn.00g052570.m01.CDS01 [Neocucurbitaria sp. VM-36]